MSHRLEFVNDPTRILTHSFVKNNNVHFINKIGGLPRLKEEVWAIVLDEDEIIAVANVTQYIFDLAKDVAKECWTDRGVLVGNQNEDYPARRKAFHDVCNSYTSGGSSFVFWWLLDDIEMQCARLGDHGALKAACDYAERKVIEYALAQQEKVP